MFLKPEVLQRTGSFKFRGAFNKLSSQCLGTQVLPLKPNLGPVLTAQTSPVTHPTSKDSSARTSVPALVSS